MPPPSASSSPNPACPSSSSPSADAASPDAACASRCETYCACRCVTASPSARARRCGGTPPRASSAAHVRRPAAEFSSFSSSAAPAWACCRSASCRSSPCAPRSRASPPTSSPSVFSASTARLPSCCALTAAAVCASAASPLPSAAASPAVSEELPPRPPSLRRASSASRPDLVDSAADRESRAATDGAQMSTEVYGFVSWIASFAAVLFFFLWAAVPHKYFHRLSINYLIDPYWALAFPVIFLICVATTFFLYTALNLLNTPSLESLDLLPDSSHLAGVPEQAHRTLWRAAAVSSAAVASLASGAEAAPDVSSVRPSPPPRRCQVPVIHDLPPGVVNRILFPLAAAGHGREAAHGSFETEKTPRCRRLIA
ncbi:PIG-P protein [Besnoitia besnoiti]|uniref:PIG-P protein n=1 Tax=Besnoitia besnoiti TaxID=94643 RepID=A0A2A9M7X2_BESBE|nr:PIG-P protein [Besnoitia besnoiti]PFH31773.1 PIG-P protein [Besnoitia besnoiti]